MPAIIPTSNSIAKRIPAFLALLTGRGWLKAADICQLDRTLTPRAIRQLAEASDGQVISCPSSGYRLTREATPEEASHALNDLRSRSRKLDQRYIATNRAWHSAPHRS